MRAFCFIKPTSPLPLHPPLRFHGVRTGGGRQKEENNMTNEQTALLLKGIADRLDRAVEQATELMPAEVAREQRRTHVAPNCYGFFCKIDGHYATADGDPLPLAPLARLLEELRAESKMLTAGEDRNLRAS